MRKEFSEALAGVTNLGEVRGRVIEVFTRVRNEQGAEQIGYVAGIINSDGSDHVQANIERLAFYTERVRGANNFPVFSATDVFIATGVYHGLDEVRQLTLKEREAKFLEFWRDIVGSHVTDIFMTPRWDKSTGARDEHETAQQKGIRIHYVDSIDHE